VDSSQIDARDQPSLQGHHFTVEFGQPCGISPRTKPSREYDLFHRASASLTSSSSRTLTGPPITRRRYLGHHAPRLEYSTIVL